MKTLDLSESVLEAMEYIEGESFEGKISQLIVNDLKSRLEKCSQRIVDYEAKYGLEFAEFERAWHDGEIENPHSHEVESDFMEWESLVEERKYLLDQLKKLSTEFTITD